MGVSGQENGLMLRGGYGFTEKKKILRKLTKLLTVNNTCDYCNTKNYYYIVRSKLCCKIVYCNLGSQFCRCSSAVMFAPCYNRHHCHHHPCCLIVVLFIIAPVESLSVVVEPFGNVG